jgi:dGTPase
LAASIWSDERLTPRKTPNDRRKAVDSLPDPDPVGVRSRLQQDYDRLLFSTPVRRLADKTQVWPMDENDGVRTRLTHSHEVANLTKSLGTRIAKSEPDIFGDTSLYDVVQPILSAIGLAHDLGNPAFGHQGEAAISRWFDDQGSWIFTHLDRKSDQKLELEIPESIAPEFTSFDGNPQTLRLLSKLQTSHGRVGLDLTAATLAASIKYPVDVDNRNDKIASIKKYGYFESERPLVDWIRKETGLAECERHPLTWIMEACDDIAYSVLDVDDLMKKSIISPDDVFVILRNNKGLRYSDPVRSLSKKFQVLSRDSRR